VEYEATERSSSVLYPVKAGSAVEKGGRVLAFPCSRKEDPIFLREIKKISKIFRY
jgi:hypothetical protein